MLGPCFVIQYSVSFLLFNHLDEEERAVCFTLFSAVLGLSVMWLFLVVSWFGLKSEIVTFPDHTHLLVV